MASIIYDFTSAPTDPDGAGPYPVWAIDPAGTPDINAQGVLLVPGVGVDFKGANAFDWGGSGYERWITGTITTSGAGQQIWGEVDSGGTSTGLVVNSLDIYLYHKGTNLGLVGTFVLNTEFTIKYKYDRAAATITTTFNAQAPIVQAGVADVAPFAGQFGPRLNGNPVNLVGGVTMRAKRLTVVETVVASIAPNAYRADHCFATKNALTASVQLSAAVSGATGAVEARVIAATTATEQVTALGVSTIVAAGTEIVPWTNIGTPSGGVITGSLDGGITLSLVALRSADALSNAVADGGVPIGQNILPHGPTIAHILDLPPIESSVPTSARLIIAANGASESWRLASIWHSTDNGTSYAQAAIISAPTIIGVAQTGLGAGSADIWDMASSVDVELLSPLSDLQSRAAADVLAGANLALLGDELIQFSQVEILSARHYRLKGLLRGRRGTEHLMGSHAVGERFVLLDPLPAGRDGLPLAQIGQTVRFKAISPQEGLGDVSAQSLVFNAHALRPLSPVALKAGLQANGDTLCTWIRRSRAGFDWIDGVDAPLAEDSELYQISILAGGTVVRQVNSALGSYLYTSSQRAADTPLGTLSLKVSQISAQVGAGPAVTLSL
jgi:hypothetical protein